MKFFCTWVVFAVIFVTGYGSVVEASGTSGLAFYVDDNVVEAAASTPNFDECLKKDSISCMQMQIFRMARDFFDRPSLQVFNGVSLDRTADQGFQGSRSFNSEAIQVEEVLEKSRSVQDKEAALENYIVGEAKNFFEKRNLRWNMGVLARSFADAAPESLKQAAGELMAEGRGKKKMLRMILPFLLGLKVKFATILGLAYLGVVLLAKKAIFVSVVSIAISIFLLLKKMFHHTHEEVHPYGHAGWQSHSDAGHVEYSAHSSPVAQHLAYSGQKPARR